MNIAMRTKIKRLREEKGISQSQMADRLHMDERNYKRIESGEKKTMDVGLLGLIAAVLETDVTELLTNETVYIDNTGDTTNTNSSAAIACSGEINVTTNNSVDPELKKDLNAIITQQQQLIDNYQKTIDRNNELIAALIEKFSK